MIPNFRQWEIWIRPGATDLRKAANGLMLLAQDAMGQDPFGKNLFLFCNADRKLLKALYWDQTGFCLWQKRLERDSFPWPRDESQARLITHAQLGLLLAGIDFWKAHQPLQVQQIS